MDEWETQPDLFSYMAAAAPVQPPEPAESPVRRLSHGDLTQLALGFLCSLHPEAVALQVPARLRKYQVTAAGFWRGEGKGARNVEKTAVVVLYEKFDHCFADCADRDRQLAAIHELRAEKNSLEELIRRTEPELGSRDDLFVEFRSWNYAGSRNAEYQKLRRRLEKLQHTLHQGSRLEHIRATGVADYCYLAVPAGLVASDEIAAGWGLVYLGPGRKFELVREAEVQEIVTPEGRQILAQNIAVAAAGAVRFAAGVDCPANGEVAFRRLPRKRHNNAPPCTDVIKLRRQRVSKLAEQIFYR